MANDPILKFLGLGFWDYLQTWLGIAIGLAVLLLSLKRFSESGLNFTKVIFTILITLSTYFVISQLVDFLTDDLLQIYKKLRYPYEDNLFYAERQLLNLSFLVVSFMAMMSLIRIMKGLDVLKSTREKLEGQKLLDAKRFRTMSHEDWNTTLSKIEAQKARKLFIDLRFFTQYVYFLSVVSVLYFAYLVGFPNTFSGVLFGILNWGLFFILDDWNIINDYSIREEGNIIKKHRRKIFIVNTLLLVVSLLFMEFAFGGVSRFYLDIRVTSILILLFLSYYARYFLDFNKYIVDEDKVKVDDMVGADDLL